MSLSLQMPKVEGDNLKNSLGVGFQGQVLLTGSCPFGALYMSAVNGTSVENFSRAVDH